jgi:regulator of cell morphogenesis and NO signaling
MDTGFTATDRVGQIVKSRPSTSRVFESYRIDYCCGGKRTLQDVCDERGVQVDAVLRDLAATKVEAHDDADVRSMTLTELVDHIEVTHHQYLKKELPRLAAMVEKVARVHGDRDVRLAMLKRHYDGMSAELLSHMQKEEQILFPLIRQMDQHGILPANADFSISMPIAVMESEHETAGRTLSLLHDLMDGYQPPSWACNTYRAMMDGLAELEHDMFQHVHKENNVLFPQSIERDAATRS